MQRPRWPVGHAAARSPKNGTTQPPMPSRIWSAPRCAANSNPRAAAARFPPAADTHRFEEAEEVKAVKKVKKVKEVKDSGVAAPWSDFVYAIATLTFSGNYPTGGDTLDFTQVADKLPSTQIVQAFAESQNGNSGYYIPVQGSGLNNWNLKALVGGGTEITAGA